MVETYRSTYLDVQSFKTLVFIHVVTLGINLYVE